MKIYYAHPLSLYNTPQEARDIAILEALGFEVFNPNCEECADGYKRRGMTYFAELITDMDALAFRAIYGGAIPAGIGQEINTALALNKRVIELPNSITSRILNVEETREYLAEAGQR